MQNGKQQALQFQQLWHCVKYYAISYSHGVLVVAIERTNLYYSMLKGLVADYDQTLQQHQSVLLQDNTAHTKGLGSKAARVRRTLQLLTYQQS